MDYTIANEIKISQSEQNEAYELLAEMGFIQEDSVHVETLNTEALRHETDFERIFNAV